MALNVAADAYYAGSTAVASVASDTHQRTRERLTADAHGVVLTLVGLPARGKSFISRKVERFLQWRGFKTRSFNVGKYRRDAVAAEVSGRSDFFSAGNAAAMASRENAATAALSDALAFLDEGGRFAILDATNSTADRRQRIREHVRTHGRSYEVLFLEAICDDTRLVEANILTKVQNSPDFAQLSLESALADLRLRIAKYEEVYETVQDDEGPSIKLYNLSSKVLANHCYGRVAKSILPYVMAIHIGARPIWLVRAGAGQANPQSPTGDRLSKLSSEGLVFALALAAFVKERTETYCAASGKDPLALHVLTSTMPRAVTSVWSSARESARQTSALNPIDKGALGIECWDLTCAADIPPWDDVERKYPEFFESWKRDPFQTRFPGGESYMDLANRLESLLIDVEQFTQPTLIVSHITVLQLLLSYFRGVPVESAWQVKVPKNTVFEVRPTAGGGYQCEEHILHVQPTCDVADDEILTPPKVATVEGIFTEGGRHVEQENAAKRQRCS